VHRSLVLRETPLLLRLEAAVLNGAVVPDNAHTVPQAQVPVQITLPLGLEHAVALVALVPRNANVVLLRHVLPELGLVGRLEPAVGLPARVLRKSLPVHRLLVAVELIPPLTLVPASEASVSEASVRESGWEGSSVRVSK